MVSQYFNMEIISPGGRDLISVEWIEVQGNGGSFLVGPNHSPLVSLIACESNLIYKKQDTLLQQEIKVSSGGIFKVENNNAIVLLDD